MNFTVTLADAEVEKMVKEILESLPEAMCCGVMVCTRWNYDNNTFEILEDEEDDGTFSKKHKLTLPKAVKAFKTLVQKWLTKGSFAWPDLTDTGFWDSPMIDSLVQVAVLGEDRYG